MLNWLLLLLFVLWFLISSSQVNEFCCRPLDFILLRITVMCGAVLGMVRNVTIICVLCGVVVCSSRVPWVKVEGFMCMEVVAYGVIAEMRAHTSIASNENCNSQRQQQQQRHQQWLVIVYLRERAHIKSSFSPHWHSNERTFEVLLSLDIVGRKSC